MSRSSAPRPARSATSPPRSGRALAEDEIAALAAVGEELVRRAGETIFRRGQRGGSMYLIVDGSVRLEFVGVKPAKRLTAGQFFGELALLRGEDQRTATARAESDSRLCRLDEAAFEHLEHNRPVLLARLLRCSCAYLVDSEQELIRDLQRRNRQLERTVGYLRRTRDERDAQEILAQTDELTGLSNRRCLNAQIGSFLERPEPSAEGLALILVDLDRFKEINDRHGHVAGDRVLRRFSHLLQGTVRSSDLPCRIGGDEFAVLLPGLAEDEASRRAERLLATFGRFEIAGEEGPLVVTASLGGTLHRYGEDWRELLERADRNLYTAKRLGGRRLVWDGEVLATVDGRGESP